ncbi:dihydroorotase [Acerihabitans arboris]|uniref:Dihydroorotase n=1 Tax=Acerihabitans arboris TaxID=2691583 RepID=A0A845SEY8_9GAMM|nr:dihydroorotase [Acerihabitans arboris]NDL61927.1 dihydroorotase [Acerihabitans arboris]
MTAQPTELTIRRPDDWHLHLRDDDMLRTVLPYTSSVFARAIVMPNLTPPIVSMEQAVAYRERILAALPAGHRFQPLMTCYLTDTLDKTQLVEGFAQSIFTAAKLYPANATTNSSHGVTSITGIYPLLGAMAEIGMPLLIHGEVTAAEIDIFDREARFIEQVLEPVRARFPTLKIVLEHITTREAAQYVLAADRNLAATITPQHLMFNRNHMLVGGVRPHLYCLPILKRNTHQAALRAAVASGCDRLFLGTDSAPHGRNRKESDCGCAGVFNAPNVLAAYAAVFEEIGALAHFEAFCSLNGPRFYGLPINEAVITLRRSPLAQPESIALGDDTLVPFLAGQVLNWSVDA